MAWEMLLRNEAILITWLLVTMIADEMEVKCTEQLIGLTQIKQSLLATSDT
jgi:hypothetical protein